MSEKLLFLSLFNLVAFSAALPPRLCCDFNALPPFVMFIKFLLSNSFNYRDTKRQRMKKFPSLLVMTPQPLFIINNPQSLVKRLCDSFIEKFSREHKKLQKVLFMSLQVCFIIPRSKQTRETVKRFIKEAKEMSHPKGR